MSLPGTGLFYTVDKRNLFSSGKKQRKSTASSQQGTKNEPPQSLSLGFFDRLTIPKEEQIVVQGFRALVEGRHDEALRCFEQAPTSADAHWIAGMIRLKEGAHSQAEHHLHYALEHTESLGSLVGKYGVEVILKLPITDTITAYAQPRRRGTLLALIESLQDRGAFDEAKHYAKILLGEHPDDVVVQLSYIELHASTQSEFDEAFAKDVVAKVADIANLSEVHAALLMYKGMALSALGLNKAALATLTKAYRSKKDRSTELLYAIRYQRIAVYQALGQHARARTELEGLYSADPTYEDVAEQLGL